MDMPTTLPQPAARRGYVLTELLVSVTLLGTLGAMALSLEAAAAKANQRQLAILRCLAAAQAELDSLTATGLPLPQADARRLWPDVRVELRFAPGKGDWAGLTVVTAVASAPAAGGGRPASVELRRYVVPRTLAEAKP